MSGFMKLIPSIFSQDTKNAMVTQHHAMVMASKEQGQPEFLTSRTREVDGAAQVTQEHKQQLVNGCLGARLGILVKGSFSNKNRNYNSQASGC